MSLITTPNLPHPDDAYAALIAAHHGMTKPQSDALNARLILILMNHIGDHVVWQQALHMAKATR